MLGSRLAAVLGWQRYLVIGLSPSVILLVQIGSGSRRGVKNAYKYSEKKRQSKHTSLLLGLCDKG